MARGRRGGAARRHKRTGAGPAQKPAETVPQSSDFRAIVVYSRGLKSEGGLSDFYLDNVIVGSEDDAEVERRAVEAAKAVGPSFRAFVAPLVSGFRGVWEKLKVGNAPTEFNVWLMRRDGVDGNREYQVALVKKHVSQDPPEHDDRIWLCEQIGDGWVNPRHLATYERRQELAKARRERRSLK